MRKIVFSLLVLISCLSIGAQESFTEEAGKVTQYEMSMTDYDKDPEAEALVIYDLGEYYFRSDQTQGLLLEMKMRKKIKILKQAGIKYADFEIPYYIDSQDWETIEQLEATTYNIVDGQLTKTRLNSKNVHEERVSDKVRVKKIALSDVREGSVVEISYTISTPYFKYMREWYFQEQIPVVHSKIRYRAIPYYEYSYIVKGVSKMDEFESKPSRMDSHLGPYTYREMIYDFGLKDIPAFRDGEFISSSKDYISSIHFQMAKINYPQGGHSKLISTWVDICDDFLKNEYFGKYLKSSAKKADKILPQLDLEGIPPVKKLQIITEYVKDNYKWDGSNGRFISYKLSEFLKQKTGNAANINLFLTGLLQKAGLDANPLLISTRNNGAISMDHPFGQFFNYVIATVHIDGRDYLIDATEPLLYYMNLPERCINVLGLIVEPKQKQDNWLITKQESVTMSYKEFVVNVNPVTNSAHIKAKYMSNGNIAYRLRSLYAGEQDNLKKDFKSKNNIEVTGDIKIANYDKLNQPFVMEFDFNGAVEGASDKIFVHPFSNLSMSTNPFKQNSRRLPVDLIYLIGESYKSTINIPDGYKVEYIPQNFIIDNDLLSFSYTPQLFENTIVLEASYKMKQNIYEADQYNELKMTYAKMIEQLSEMIVLVKE